MDCFVASLLAMTKYGHRLICPPGFMAHVLGDHRLHVIAASRCY
jgi:hypothetical protein